MTRCKQLLRIREDYRLFELNVAKIIALLFMLSFLIITYFVMNGYTNDFDLGIIKYVYNHRSTTLNNIFKFITSIGDTKTVILFLAIFLLIKQTRFNLGTGLTFTMMISATLLELVKHIVCRNRPPEIYRLISETNFSFPSGHSMNNFVLYAVFIMILNQLSNDKVFKYKYLYLIFIPFAIAISRVYVAVHYPTDIIGGFLLAGVLISLRYDTMFQSKKIRRKK